MGTTRPAGRSVLLGSLGVLGLLVGLAALQGCSSSGDETSSSGREALGSDAPDDSDPSTSLTTEVAPRATHATDATDATAPGVTSAASVTTDGTPAAPASDDAASPTTSPGPRLGDGPVTYIALGDSLTAGDGDENDQGYVGLIGAAIVDARGTDDVVVSNYGASGWDSTMMVVGQEGAPAQLGQALPEVEAAVAAGRAVLATVLIGSNDMWYLYEYGPPEGTPAAAEDAAVDVYRDNLDRAVAELTDAGAVVVVGVPDDQSLRPSVRDIDRLHDLLPDVTAEEVRQMAVIVDRLEVATREVAAAHGALVIDTNAPFWADESKMADDGIHPNAAGYADFAELWLAAIRDLL